MCYKLYVTAEYGCLHLGVHWRHQRCRAAMVRGYECERRQTTHQWVRGVSEAEGECRDCRGDGVGVGDMVYRDEQGRLGRQRRRGRWVEEPDEIEV